MTGDPDRRPASEPGAPAQAQPQLRPRPDTETETGMRIDAGPGTDVGTGIDAGTGAGIDTGLDTGPDAPILEQAFDADSLYALRAAVAAHAAEAGLSPGRSDDLVIAVHELAANSVRHGAGHGRLRVWRADHSLLCEISDEGVPPADDAQPPEGAQPPDGAGPQAQPGSGDGAGPGPDRDVAAHWRAEPGHGLSLVRQVADQASLTSGPDGTVATISFAIGAPDAPFGLDRGRLDGCTVLAVTGLLDLSSAGQLTEAIDVLLSRSADLSLVLDLSRLAGWDSAGLAALITAQQRITASPPAAMVLAALPEQLSRHLDEAGLAAGFTLAASAAAAARLLA
jgi:anti-anti-sigma factor